MEIPQILLAPVVRFDRAHWIAWILPCGYRTGFSASDLDLLPTLGGGLREFGGWSWSRPPGVVGVGASSYRSWLCDDPAVRSVPWFNHHPLALPVKVIRRRGNEGDGWVAASGSGRWSYH